jgi:hypothetical protein
MVMEEAPDTENEEDDFDYEYDPLAPVVGMNEVMDSRREMRLYVGQCFDAQDARLKKIQASIQRWENATTFNVSPRQFYSTLNEHGP